MAEFWGSRRYVHQLSGYAVERSVLEKSGFYQGGKFGLFLKSATKRDPREPLSFVPLRLGTLSV